jgi:diguanylate cyclase (GGDEF)-like protein
MSMMSPSHRRASAESVRIELRNALFATALPNAVMTAIFATLGFKIASSLRDPIAWTALVSGIVCAGLKLLLIAAHRRRDRSAARHDRWARAFAVLSVGLAFSLGLLGARAFVHDAVLLQMLSTGLLFGYCSGLVAHTSIRPWLAVICLVCSAVPIAISAALRTDSAHQLLAASLICFMLAAFQSVRHLYQATRQQIITRHAMATLARVDPLTKLPNRLGLREAFTSHRREDNDIAIHCLDLDAFKPVNDRYGHPTGDALLTAVSDRVRSVLQPHDTAARVGGDEFVIIQSGVRSQSEADLFARTLVRRIMAPYEIDTHQIRIGVSLGFVTASGDANDLDELVALADAALYQAKQTGGGIGRATLAAH